MSEQKSIFFCALGGSGMLPLAMIMQARGCRISGSDRSYDQGRTPERFAFIAGLGMTLFPQDGSGVGTGTERVIVSAAVEPEVPDYQKALALHIPIQTRAALLAETFNAADVRLAVAGTSGKSTTTGMLGWILHEVGLNPTIVNGAVMKNFVTREIPFASAVVGRPDLFVAEVDESDGSIAHYTPTIAVLNNVALDHKSMEELRALFGAYIAKAERAVLNLDNAETAVLARDVLPSKKLTYSLRAEAEADLTASAIRHTPQGSVFQVTWRGQDSVSVRLNVPGEHNISNSLAALGAALSVGVELKQAARALETFEGIARRLEVVGMAAGVTVLDDFAHNPDKIRATLRTLHQSKGRLLLLFQPHGYGPLRLMREAFAACFAENLDGEDLLILCDPLYLGGTTQRLVTSADIVQDIQTRGRKALYQAQRAVCTDFLLKEARAGDRIVIMGARDDSLSALAREVLEKLMGR